MPAPLLVSIISEERRLFHCEDANVLRDWGNTPELVAS